MTSFVSVLVKVGLGMLAYLIGLCLFLVRLGAGGFSCKLNFVKAVCFYPTENEPKLVW